jgi:uncharacterized protein (TIGR02680 family)
VTGIDAVRPLQIREQWLSRALTGGLPEPALRRWQPLRVGIVNLWEYDNAEFWFADGRLVLRGGNGAGKTKVLELTTLLLLRGEIAPSVLDPFGSQHRTMKFNLLPTGDDDDPRPPSDAGLGYAWVEFGRVDDTGQPSYFVCGLGMSARRGTGTSSVTTWHLVTTLRPGRDLRLVIGDRPLEQKDLKKVAGVEVIESAAKYRARLADELFGLGPDAYDNLTELLKQLRRPKLGERLNPSSLAETLRAALPPLAGAELTQLADGWDNLEKLRKSVEDTKEAATQVARFVRTGWLPWARTIVRQRADAFASATTKLDNTTTARREAEGQLVSAQAEVRALAEAVKDKKAYRQDLRAELNELMESDAYKDAISAADRVRSLHSQLNSLNEQRGGAEDRQSTTTAEAESAASTAEEVASQVERATGDAEKAIGLVSARAQPAGLQESALRHLPAREVPTLRSDLTARLDRLSRLQDLGKKHSDAAEQAQRSAEAVSSREDDVREATRQLAVAEQELADAVEALRLQIRDWSLGTTVATASEQQVEDWCDLVAELTSDDPNHSRHSPSAAITRHLEQTRETLRASRTALDLELTPLVGEHGQLDTELTRVLERPESQPEPPTSWHRRKRPELFLDQGAPLWQCVQPVSGVQAADLDLLEATLAAAGLLDAWLSPDGRLTVAGDEPETTLLAGEPDQANLTAVLEPTPAGGVTEPVIRDVLAAIGWRPGQSADDSTASTWLAADGTWRNASLTGRAEPSRPASYLGATAREAARQRTITRLRARLAELGEMIASINERIDQVKRDLSTLAEEGGRVPPERPVTDSVATVRERERRVTELEEKVHEAAEAHRRNETARDSAWADFARYAGDHAFPLKDLEAHRQALQEYHTAVESMAAKLNLLAVQTSRYGQAKDELAKAERRLTDVRKELTRLADRIRRSEIQLRTAEQALSRDAKEQLARREELDRLVTNTETELDQLDEKLTNARVDAGTAEKTLEQHEGNRLLAEQVRDAALADWWETYEAGLAVPVGVDEPERRSVEAARESTRSARRNLATGDVERAWRQCFERLQALRQELLPNRDARVRESDRDGALPQMLILADSSTGSQPPTSAAELLADQARRQEEAFDAEQQRVLATLLGSTFIEHLKDRLDYTARTFTDINRELASHPTRHGNAVQLKWDPDPVDPDAGKVVEALTQGYQQLTPAKQDDVRSFLARKIDQARADAAADGTGDWREQLSSALDYRSWLKISLQYRPGATSRWVPFDAAKHGAKSGGEKVVLLSQPLFAAAVVAYNAAADHAPRCVWLDEAMTGVDEEIKASFMGLTVSFDLDVMLTAHDEWCKYPTVPAVAVYDLARHKGLPGVDAVPYLWCGGEWIAVEIAARDDDTTDVLQVADGLFAEAEPG